MGETDWEKLVLVLMGGAILSKFLIRFSVDGGAVFPSGIYYQKEVWRGKIEFRIKPH